jgi:hypothetical protein
MVAVFFSGLVIAALLSLVSEMFMRIRLAKTEEWNQLPWWRRGGDDAAAIYQQRFPRSRLPLFRKSIFWLVTASAAGALVIILWKSN